MQFGIYKKRGFTLVEITVYVFITIILLISISSLVMNVFNIRKMLRASDDMSYNARLIANFLGNRVHNVDYIENVGPDPAQVMFYASSTERFSVALEDGNLVYRLTQNTGSGFPLQSSATPVILNSAAITVSDLILTPMADNAGRQNRGVAISFVLATPGTNDPYRYIRESYRTFISIR